jgi:ubiquitin C-terminal hydrolase
MKSIDDIDFDNGNKQSNGGQRSFGAIILRKRSTKEQSLVLSNSNICLYPGFGACGLSNLGNTCYMNSAVQCISYIPLLRAYLISGRFRKHGEVNFDNPLGTGGKVLEELAILEETIWSGKFGVRYPSRFRNQLGRCLSQYSSNDQQDAQEFLNDLLDSLHEDSNKVIKKPYVEALEDRWVDRSDLHQVGEETWRRYLRRNRSIIANIGMGQVLNRVTCPVCEYTSHNFDPFNMLSIPFPTLSDVVFHCKLLRRANEFNCTTALNGSKEKSSSPILEEYVVSLPRLADIGDLKHKLHDLCGTPINNMKIFVADNISTDANTDIRSYVDLFVLPEKEGPCLQYARQNEPGNFLSPNEIPTTIFVFESTLKLRQADLELVDHVQDDDWHSQNIQNQKKIAQNELKLYGDSSLDTVPTRLAKSISCVMWPKSMDEVLIGLRVDAIDERGHWFPGSIVEVTEIDESAEPSKQKAKVHFDNFSTKWDLYFTFNDIVKGKVCPLYSHTQPKESPLEFLIYNSSESDSSGLFGTPFHLECFSEWSVARAAAHILTQASRFVDRDEKKNKVQRALTKTIDTLLEYDKLYMNVILSNADDKSTTISSLKLKCQSLQKEMQEKLSHLLQNLPFDIYLCDASTLNTEDEDACILFNYRLDGSIGNLMNARNGILLHWRKHGNRFFFQEPEPVLHSSTDSLRSNDTGMSMHRKKLKYSHGGMPLAVCLDEFCNEQNLSSEDCWRCPRCKEFREGRQSMKLWRLPDILTFHLKRFNCSAKWREKITTKINFPLTGLDMKQWCDKDSAALHSSEDSYVYDLIGVVNHYGGMTGGHYVAFCKATGCSPEGSEEVEHNFTGAGVHAFGAYEEKGNNSSTWKLGRNKDKDSSNAHTKTAVLASKAVAEGSEPLWLQFDDESVEPIPPRCVNSENAYVLFYRKRRISPYNIARYSSME